MISNLSLDPMQRYIISAKAREKERLATLQQRQQEGLQIARQAAAILKEEFGANQVILLGSLFKGNFHETSDIDLAVTGLPERLYFKAVSRLLSLGDL